MMTSPGMLTLFDAKLPLASLRRHCAACPGIVGETLAQQVLDHARKNRLGYFPALDYFKCNPGVDADLVQAAENVAWLAVEMAVNEVRLGLRPICAELRFQMTQCTAFLLPRCRPADPDVFSRLADHYTPDKIRINLVVFPRNSLTDITAEAFGKEAIGGLRKRFAALSVHSIIQGEITHA